MLCLINERFPVTLRWVRSHIGTQMNEFVDELAKAGCEKTPIKSPMPFSHIKQSLRQSTRTEWSDQWVTYEDCKHTKIFYPDGPDRKKSQVILHLNKQLFSSTVWQLTGFSGLSKQNNNMGVAEGDTSCRLCLLDDNETSAHKD